MRKRRQRSAITKVFFVSLSTLIAGSQAFYITLDLTTHVVPSLSARRTPYKSNKSIEKLQADRTNAKVPQKVPNGRVVADSPDAPSRNAIQIIDLHGPNPLIAYNNQVYTCHWATDIGTSVFLSAPNEDPDLTHLPLRSFRSFDLIGMSSARLMGVPASVRPRVSLPPVTNPRQDALDDFQIVSTTPEGDTVRFSESRGYRFDLPSTAPPEKVSQARFLERLSAIKRGRGQTDAVPVKAIKGYTRPENWMEERQEWLAKERAEQDARMREEATQKANSRPASVRPQSDDQRAAATREASESVETEANQHVDGDTERQNETQNNSNKRSAPEDSTSEAIELPNKRRGPTGRPPGRPRKLQLDEQASEADGARPAEALQSATAESLSPVHAGDSLSSSGDNAEKSPDES